MSIEPHLAKAFAAKAFAFHLRNLRNLRMIFFFLTQRQLHMLSAAVAAKAFAFHLHDLCDLRINLFKQRQLHQLSADDAPAALSWIYGRSRPADVRHYRSGDGGA